MAQQKQKLKIFKPSQRSRLGMGFDKLFGTQYEDVAGLQPLPMSRMFRQAGKPMRTQVKPGDAHALTIQRNQTVRNIIDNWNPLKAEDQQRLNNTNPNKRSQLTIAPTATSMSTLRDLEIGLEERARRAMNRSRPKSDYELAGENWKASEAVEANYRKNADLSDYFTANERKVAKEALFSLFRKKKGEVKLDDVPINTRARLGTFAKETVEAYNKMLRSNLVDMLDLTRDTIKPIDTISNPNPRGAGLPNL